MQVCRLSHWSGVIVTLGSLTGVAAADTIAHWRFDEGSGQAVLSEEDMGNTYELQFGPSGSTASDPVRVAPGRDGTGGALQFVNDKTNTEGGVIF